MSDFSSSSNGDLIPNGKNHTTCYPRTRNGFTSALQDPSKSSNSSKIANGNGYLANTENKPPSSVLSKLNMMATNLFYFFWKYLHTIFSVNSKKSNTFQNGDACKFNGDRSAAASFKSKESFEAPQMHTVAVTMLGFFFAMSISYINRFLFPPKVASESKNRTGYVPLYNKFSMFYSQYVYRRVRDCWNTPIRGTPGVEIEILNRVSNDYNWTFEFSGTSTKCINLGSYNYLGFAENSGPNIDACDKVIKRYGVSLCSPAAEYGLSPLHFELEKLTAEFVGMDDAIVFGMGFATNVLNLPCILTEGSLVFSDEKNHASLILSLRLSKASFKVFKHNDMEDLERKCRAAIVQGQPKTKKPWTKILVIVEGVYSMEGSIVNLPRLMELKAKYKFYLYVDEAHSIGALGPNGRGVTDYFGINPREVDILMGTFTKSFSAAGGYIAGPKPVIDYIRRNSHATYYAPTMSPPIAQQIFSTMKIIMGKDRTDDGARRLRQLRINVRYFRRRLHQIGVIIYGHENSPVVPFIVFLFSKIHSMLKELNENGIATVGVGFPATELYMGRLRFCVSAGHTKEQLDKALAVIDKLSDKFGLKYSRKPRFKGEIKYEDEF